MPREKGKEEKTSPNHYTGVARLCGPNSAAFAAPRYCVRSSDSGKEKEEEGRGEGREEKKRKRIGEEESRKGWLIRVGREEQKSVKEIELRKKGEKDEG